MAGANGCKKTTTGGMSYYELEINLNIQGMIVGVKDGVIHITSVKPEDMEWVAGVLRQAREEAESLAKMKEKV